MHKFFYSYLFKMLHILGVSGSFSADGEDYILLKYLSGLEDGLYIDIGSHKPIKHSVTYPLYLMGWHGLCVDPLPSLRKRYKKFRKNDVFLNVGVSHDSTLGDNQTLEFYYYKNHPDNSTFDSDQVDMLRDIYNRTPSSVKHVPVISVEKLLDVYKLKINTDKIVHLLNLDIEGGELSILETLFINKVFPWFICVEELGFIAEDLNKSSVNKLVGEYGYILVAKTFLSSIYMRQGVDKYLNSSFVKSLKINS